jgi:hypothetical protein
MAPHCSWTRRPGACAFGLGLLWNVEWGMGARGRGWDARSIRSTGTRTHVIWRNHSLKPTARMCRTVRARDMVRGGYGWYVVCTERRRVE